MNIKNIFFQEIFESDDLHKEKTRLQYQIDNLEKELEKTLNEQQIETYEKILDLLVEIHGIDENLLAEHVWNVIKSLYRELLFF